MRSQYKQFDDSVNHYVHIESARSAINYVFMKAGKKLKQAIEDSRMNQAEFSRAMGVDPQTVQNWINRGIAAKHSFKAGRLLGRNPEWLVFDDDDLPARLSEDAKSDLNRYSDLWDDISDEDRELVSLLIERIARPQ